jgi:hypothetical protein
MADIGADKYLLLQHPGGDFTVRLYLEPPWYWPTLRAVGDAFDHVTSIHHAQGSVAPSWIASATLSLLVAWVYFRHKPPLGQSLPLVITAGLLLAALRGGYALFHRPYLTALYTQWLRTMDRAFEISLPFLSSTFIVAACGTWLYVNARSRWARSGAFLVILFPNWAMAVFWLGSEALINALAGQRYGLPLYAYGGGLMPLIACAVEGALTALALWRVRRLARPAPV